MTQQLAAWLGPADAAQAQARQAQTGSWMLSPEGHAAMVTANFVWVSFLVVCFSTMAEHWERASRCGGGRRFKERFLHSLPEGQRALVSSRKEPAYERIGSQEQSAREGAADVRL